MAQPANKTGVLATEVRRKLIISLLARIEHEISSKNPVSFLSKHPIDEWFDTAVETVYMYTRPKKGSGTKNIFFSEVVCAIGNAVRSRLMQPKNSSVAAKTGAFILYSFQIHGLLKVYLGKGNNQHNAYVVEVVNDEVLAAMWIKVINVRTGKLPSLTPYAPWTGFKHETGLRLVKTNDMFVKSVLKPDTHPIVFESINKSQEVGWRINKQVYEIQVWALKNKTEAFSDIWEQADLQARATKLREAKTIADLAKRFLEKTFYHIYYYDFRCRKYPVTSYLHEQGTDVARGLLMRADSAELGLKGFEWMLISIASTWGNDAGLGDGTKTDKLPLVDRVKWVLDNEEMILGFAEKPKENQEWMKADKPWQFLAACKELMAFRIWQAKVGDFESYAYKSHMEVYIDGSTNGSQHLAALCQDEITATHVNLVPMALPGDLYGYVAESVWGYLEFELNNIPEDLQEECRAYISELLNRKRDITNSHPGSEERKLMVEGIRAFKLENAEKADASSIVFWSQFKDKKSRRKIIKR